MSEYEETNRNDDNLNYKSICCMQIPEHFLDKLVAKKHFSRFGRINRFILRPTRRICTVEYENEEDAERAYLEAGSYNGQTFDVSFSEREVAHVQNTEEWVDPEVQAELEAMGGCGTRFGAPPSATTMMLRQAQQSASSPIMRTLKQAAPQLVQKPTTTRAIAPAAVEAPKIDAALRNELESLLRRPAYTVEDKYRVLDARDKLIRLTTIRQTDIKKAVSTRGTCPDMCPEKERLMREFQRQVSCFETADDNDTSIISHRRAIKEYSRSSADQEVPLSHELRPESVLHMTMLYLMHRIMDMCDDERTSLADWFHFVWDRTRSIRKDITQQELCSLPAVELVEQCARFHIHCAARLVAEDPSVFDKKINAENLTKCLQSLKYMYHDLRIKGVPCPCEAEFRSYIVLLNLGDANFLWELKQLPAHIQKSRDIKRAIDFYNALQNNNYVRFFEMIRSPETSYLSACILLGYFNRLRLRAMEVIVKSHNWRKNPVFLPLSYLYNVLGFEDEQTAMSFFLYHGLQCDEERVMLERLKKPDIEYSMDRAIELVESKRENSVGECVCGYRLPSSVIFERHQPHNSFDGNGLLKPIAWNADDQLRGQTKSQAPPMAKTDSSIFKVPHASPLISPKQQQFKQPQQKSMTPPPSIFGGTQQFGEVKQSGNTKRGSAESMSTKSEQPPTFKLPTSSPTQNAFLQSILKPNPPAAAGGNIFTGASGSTHSSPGGNIFGAAAKETANIFQQPAAKSLPHKHDNIFQQFRTEPPAFGEASNKMMFTASPTITNEAQKLAQQQQRMRELEEEQRRKQQQLQEERAKLKTLEEKKMKQLEEQRMRVEQAKAESKRKEVLAVMQQRAEKLLAQEWQAWLSQQIAQVAKEELHQRQHFEQRCEELMRTTLEENTRAQVEEVAHEEYAVMCHDQMILTRYFNRWLEHMREKRRQRQLMESTPIWVTTSTRAQQAAEVLHPRQQENLQLIKRYRHGEPCDFKKLLWMSPHFGDLPPLDVFEVITKHLPPHQQQRKYFKLLLTLPHENEELPGFESLCHKWLRKYVRIDQELVDCEAFICGTTADLALCVRQVSGIVPMNELGDRVRHECDNADAIICFMSCQHLANTRKRLHHLLKLSQQFKRLPLAIVAFNAQHQDELQLSDTLELEQLRRDGQLGSYRFYGCLTAKSEFSFRDHFLRALRFVAGEACLEEDERDALEMQQLQSWLETCLGEEMWQRWHDSVRSNPAFAKVCTMPQHVIGIYHAALARVREMASLDLQDASEFPIELREFVPLLDFERTLTLAYFPHNWKDEARQREIDNFLKQLYLPALEAHTPIPASDLNEQELWLLNYASRCIPERDEAATEASYHAISALIAQLNRPDLQDVELTKRFGLISYLPVIKALVFARVNHVLKHKRSPHLPTELIYRRQALLDYQAKPWWLNHEAVEAVSVDYTQTAEDIELEKENNALPSYEESCQMLQEVITKAEAVSRKIENELFVLRTIKKSTTKTHVDSELTRELDASIYQFEMAKQIGVFDVPPAALEDDMHDDRQGAVGGVPSPKRRRRQPDEEVSEMDKTIAHAFNLIEKVETKQDYRERLNTTIQLEHDTTT